MCVDNENVRFQKVIRYIAFLILSKNEIVIISFFTEEIQKINQSVHLTIYFTSMFWIGNKTVFQNIMLKFLKKKEICLLYLCIPIRRLYNVFHSWVSSLNDSLGRMFQFRWMVRWPFCIETHNKCYGNHRSSK